MSDLFWLSERQLAKIEPHFPLSHGVLRVDDRRVISGIVHVIRNGLRWRDAPPVYGPHKTLCRQRHRIENLFARLKDWRRIHTRYDRCADIFFAAVIIAVLLLFWIEP